MFQVSFTRMFSLFCYQKESEWPRRQYLQHFALARFHHLIREERADSSLIVVEQLQLHSNSSIEIGLNMAKQNISNSIISLLSHSQFTLVSTKFCTKRPKFLAGIAPSTGLFGNLHWKNSSYLQNKKEQKQKKRKNRFHGDRMPTWE